MCGRTVCSLAPQKLCKACQFVNPTGELTKPIWKPAADGHEYYPSYNFCPQNYGPVLLSGSQFKESGDYKSEDRIIQPMKWGLVPSWSKDFTSFKTINARSDSLLSKNTFKTPLTKGRRCIVVVDGFYEWQTEKSGEKHAYFIHLPQSKDVNWENPDEPDDVADSGEWSGRRLMFIAGLFDINKQISSEPVYTYSLITVDTSKRLSFLHDRMPAILTDDESAQKWLDFENVPLQEALKVLKPVEDVNFFKVSKNVNNVAYKGTDCVRLFDEKNLPKMTSNQKNLLSYFAPVVKKSPVKEEKCLKRDPIEVAEADDADRSPNKKAKSEDCKVNPC